MNRKTVANVLADIDAGWRNFAAAVTAVPESDADAPGPFGWSIKDVVANVMGWERELIAVLAAQPAHLAMGIDAATYSAGETDVINAVMYAQHRARPFADVWADAQATHTRLRELISPLSWERVAGPLFDELALPANEDRVTVLDWIAAGTYDHYLDHERDLIVIAEQARLARV